MTMCDVGEGGKRYCDVTQVTFTARLIVRESEIRASEGTAMESYTGISIRTLWAWYSHHSELCWQPRMIPTPSPIPRCSGWTLGRPWLLSLLYKQIELQRPA